MIRYVVAAWLLGLASVANATTFISTTSAANLGAFHFAPGDLVNLDDNAIELRGAYIFDATENIDAVARYGDGWILSTSTDSSIQGVPYLDGDLILWQPAISKASLFFSEAVFGTDEDIDALEVSPDGRLLLSTTTSARLAGLSFTSGDVVAYDRTTGAASLWFKGSNWFDATENIDALALLPDASMLFSTSTDASIKGWTFRDGDVIRFDGAAFSLWFSESAFGADEDIDALAVFIAGAQTNNSNALPEPGTLFLFSLGMAGIGWAKAKSKRA